MGIYYVHICLLLFLNKSNSGGFLLVLFSPAFFISPRKGAGMCCVPGCVGLVYPQFMTLLPLTSGIVILFSLPPLSCCLPVT